MAPTPFPTPLAGAAFNLNSAGVAGFFGGKEAISAMATVHLCEGRQWLGWFNSPGSYIIAKRFGRMANGRFWDGLFPGPNDSPTVTFKLDGKKGPKYVGAFSGTEMDTGHLGHLTVVQSKRLEELEKTDVIKGRETLPIGVSYLAMKHVNYKTPIERLPPTYALLGLFPIAVSIVTCVMCALVYDWIGFGMILLGIICSGLASLTIGNGMPFIKSVKKPASGAPPGHGVLVGDEEKEMVVIKGTERDVNAITKGRFELKYKGIFSSKQNCEEEENGEGEGGEEESEGGEGESEGGEEESEGGERGKDPQQRRKTKQSARKYHEIGLSALLLIVQFLLQLLLIPQATLFGQTMFLVSLGISWGYNSYLSSLEKEKIQSRLLFKWLGEPEMVRFQAGTRTTMAVFVCLLLFHGTTPSPEKDKERRLKVLSSCIPNDTGVWKLWREMVVSQILNLGDSNSSESSGLSYLDVNEENEQFKNLSPEGKKLLKVLLRDARNAINKYSSVRGKLPVPEGTVVGAN